MKKILLTGTSLVTLAILFAMNIDVLSTKETVKLNLEEKVEAKFGYRMENAPCPGGGIYKRCGVRSGSCSVHRQTLC